MGHKDASGIARYDPYPRYSPYFVKAKKEGFVVNDNIWNQQHAGTCVGDVIEDFLNDQSWVLGSIRGTQWSVSVRVLNGDDHRRFHPSGASAPPTWRINERGIYTLNHGHYYPPTDGIFLVGTIMALSPYTHPSADRIAARITIPEGANEKTQRKQFTPADVTIREGEAVEWINDDRISSHLIFSGSVDHHARNLGNLWKSPIITAGSRFAQYFMEAGIFQYASPVYPHLRGKITVLKHEAPKRPALSREEKRRRRRERLVRLRERRL